MFIRHGLKSLTDLTDPFDSHCSLRAGSDRLTHVMKTHRFIVDVRLAKGLITVQDESLARQMASVLKLKTGETVVLSDGQGSEAKGTIARLDKKSAVVDLGEPGVCAIEPERKVVLCCAILKRENFEWVVQKATEVGVGKIVPLITDRTVKQSLKTERLHLIAKEAAEQSGRCRVPEIIQPMTLSEALAEADVDRKLFFHVGTPQESKTPTVNDDPIKIFVGPEGGWTDAEVDLAKNKGCLVQGLGDLALRGETAAVCASFVAVNGLRW